MDTLPCPFCGNMPTLSRKKAGCRDELYYVYSLSCPSGCASMSTVLSDKEESLAYWNNHRNFNVQDAMAKKYYWEQALPKLLTKWNKRV